MNWFTLTCDNPEDAAALCILLFSTSAGAHTVVATVPAIKEDAICTGTPSETLRSWLERSAALAWVYLELGQRPLSLKAGVNAAYTAICETSMVCQHY